MSNEIETFTVGDWPHREEDAGIDWVRKSDHDAIVAEKDRELGEYQDTIIDLRKQLEGDDATTT